MSTLTIQWVKSTTDTWLPFATVDLSEVTTKGVYMIWYRGQPGRVVYVGQGDVASRISAHRSEQEILAYQANGLLVTWASVPKAQRDGVERYLADTWNPLVGDAHPDAEPIAVNSPW